MAQELARELVAVQRKNNKQSIVDAFSRLKKAVINAWNTIKNAIMNLVDSLRETERKKKHNYNWYVPKNTMVPSQKISNIKIPNIRNHI